MVTRTRSESVVFSHPFELRGVDRVLPPGVYQVVTDKEPIEELSFPVYRRVSRSSRIRGQSQNRQDAGASNSHRAIWPAPTSDRMKLADDLLMCYVLHWLNVLRVKTRKCVAGIIITFVWA